MNNQSKTAQHDSAQHILVPGSALEVVYRRTRKLMSEPPTPEFPDSGNGVAWVHDVQRLLVPLMPQLSDRNETRVCHYLVLLKMYGFLDIDPDHGMITLPAGVEV